MKKFLVVILILLLVILFSFVVIITFRNNYYSLEKVISMINTKITDNMSIKKEVIYNDNTSENNYTITIFLKDQKASQREQSSTNIIEEFIFDIDNKTQININHYDKTIISFFDESLTNNVVLNLLASDNEILKDTLNNNADTYKYYGKEKIDGKEYIKISVIVNENYFYDIKDSIKIYYYINEQEKTISKVEAYTIKDGEELIYTNLYSYFYDAVVDSDILDFDINQYSDYEYNENFS